MSALGLNKIVGAVLLTTLVLFVIGKLGDNLVGAGGGHGPVPAPVVATGPAAPAPVAAEPEVPLPQRLAVASADRGRKVFNKCKACHSVSEGGKNGVGPNLWNVVNAAPAQRAGFRFSSALSGLGDKPWTYENLDAFLAKPRAYAKGTKMTFVGLRKARDRADVILFLRNLSADPAPLE